MAQLSFFHFMIIVWQMCGGRANRFAPIRASAPIMVSTEGGSVTSSSGGAGPLISETLETESINKGAISLLINSHNNIEQDLRCLWFAQLPYKKRDGDEEYFYKYAKTAASDQEFFEVTNAFGSFYHLDGLCSAIFFLFVGFRTDFPLLNLQNALVRRFLRCMMVLTTL